MTTPVYQVARATVQSAEHLLQQAARGDQDKMLEHAIATLTGAAIVCTRLGDPIGLTLLEYLEKRLQGEDSWNMLARSRARLEAVITRELQETAAETDEDDPRTLLAELRKERRQVAQHTSVAADLDERIAAIEDLLDDKGEVTPVGLGNTARLA